MNNFQYYFQFFIFSADLGPSIAPSLPSSSIPDLPDVVEEVRGDTAPVPPLPAPDSAPPPPPPPPGSGAPVSYTHLTLPTKRIV